jgi:hypothetical protein
MKRHNPPRLIDEDVLARTALILGESSAAHRAVEDAKARREAGQEVAIVQVGDQLIVLNISPDAATT